MKKYQSYKPSGVEWVGEIPEHWGTTKIKYTKDESKNSFIDGDWIESKDLSDEGIRYITSGNIGVEKYKEQGYGFISEETFNDLNCTELFEGDLVISRLFLPVGRSCILPNLNCRVVTCVDNVILRPKKSFNKYFLNYQFNCNRYSEYTELISRGVTLTRISRGILGNNPIVIPPLPEQLQIVKFLDEKTDLIDKLISIKERKIDLLKQQRISLINQVVTKGLNPNVKMKDSGVEWIGEIPEHWEVSKLKYSSDIIYGISPPDTTYNDEGIGIELVNGPVEYSSTDFGYTQSTKWTTDPKKFSKMGSLLFCLRGSTTGRMNITHKDLSIGRGVCSITSNKCQWFLIYTMFILRIYIQKLISGSTFPSVTKDDVDNYIICDPPLVEQQQIVEHLDTRTREIDDLVLMEQKKIDLLKEYRQSLIYEVITGKIDVRTNLN